MPKREIYKLIKAKNSQLSYNSFRLNSYTSREQFLANFKWKPKKKLIKTKNAQIRKNHFLNSIQLWNKTKWLKETIKHSYIHCYRIYQEDQTD